MEHGINWQHSQPKRTLRLTLLMKRRAFVKKSDVMTWSLRSFASKTPPHWQATAGDLVAPFGLLLHG